MKKASGNGMTVTRLGPLLRQASRLAEAALAKALEDFYPLTPRQYDLLEAIGTGTRTQAELAALTGIDRSTMSEVLRRLEAQKLVKRPYSRADSRERNVSLTSSGAETLAKVSKAVRDAEGHLETLIGNQLPIVAGALESLCRPRDEADTR
jgi:DNA-binding MarR family transcriptional regulator